MRAFLSHSSKDKGFVETVAGMLRPGTYELDSETFDAGLINSQAIIRALRRSDLFCLFLSEASAISAYVEFETLLGVEFLAGGGIRRFLVICLDETAFAKASQNAKLFNIVRKVLTPESAARLIQGHLVSSTAGDTERHPFIGRKEELAELEEQVNDHYRPASKALFLSGNFGSGRRTIARKFFEDRYPHVGKVFPQINIDEFAGLEELYRSILTALRPSMPASELVARAQGFALANDGEKRRQLAQLINGLVEANEAAFLYDRGGILTDAGALEPEINQVISHLESRPHPPAIIIAPRMIPLRERRDEDDISYLAVRSLGREDTERLVSGLLKEREIAVSKPQLSALVGLSDAHPFNIYRLVAEIKEKGLPGFLASPTEFIDWKHRQSSEYLKKVALTDFDVAILSLLKLVPELDLTSISAALEQEPAPIGDALYKLSNLHVIEAQETFVISPALRVAVERDHRIRLPADRERTALRSLAKSLEIRIEEGTAPLALVNSAVLAALETGETLPAFASALLLPSHLVWLSKRHYDRRHWEDAIRYAQQALGGRDRLSSGGFVAACRYLCLAAARIGDPTLFQEGISKLEAVANDDWAKSNVAYLKGFNFRFQGNLPAAEELFRRSYDLSPGNLSAAREIAAISLMRGNLDDAERFAREAHSHAPSNPYFVDMLVSVLVKKHGRSSMNISEIRDMFDLLEKVSEEEDRSFFETRRAEYEHLWGNNKTAFKLIDKAINKTPNIFEPRRLLVDIFLKDGNRVKALEAINALRAMANSRNPNFRRTNYRLYLVTYAHYLTETNQYDEAKKLYGDSAVFTVDERDAAVRAIEIAESYRRRRT